NVVSFDTKLSERKYPPVSENSVTMFQNASSLSCKGSASVATRELDRLSGPKKAMSAVAVARMMRRGIVNIIREPPDRTESILTRVRTSWQSEIRGQTPNFLYFRNSVSVPELPC